MKRTLISLAICLSIIFCFATIVDAATVNFYDEDGGNQVGSMYNIYDTPTDITIEIPTKPGNDFAGWDTNDQRLIISDDQVSGPAWNPYSWWVTLNAYATWDLTNYEITYELDGGSAEGNPSTYTIEDEDITLTNPIREGYEFVGWTDEEGMNLGTEVVIPTGSTGDRTFIAVWNPIVYTISYELDGGTAIDNPETYTIEDSFTLNNPTKEGFEFVGWTDEEGTDLGTKVTIEEGTTEDKTFIAKWEAIPEVVEEEKEEKTTSNPATGDYIALYTVILAIAVAGIIIVRKLRK